MTTGMALMPCQWCGELAEFTIAGACERCAPSLHEAYREVGRQQDIVGEAFFAKTGQTPLAAWHEFEAFTETPVAANYRAALDEFARLLQNAQAKTPERKAATR